jgi:probable F420-dependent oxidoreductase
MVRSGDRPLRFGCVARAPFTARADWRERVRRIDGWGFDTVLVPDHVGMWSPFPPLLVAADASDRLRLGTQVLNIEFWNPLLLAREAATVDLLTDGRLELGFGAGHAEVEFAAAGLPYPRAGIRVDHLAEQVDLVRRLLAGETVTGGERYGLAGGATGLTTVQGHVPFLVGGNGDRVLRLAARHADIVGLVGFNSGSGQVHDDLSHFTWSGLAERVAHVRAEAGGRFEQLELSVLIQAVTVTDDRAGAVATIAARFERPAELITDSPFLLIGSVAEVADQVRRLRDECGVTYVTVFEPAGADLAPVIDALR